MRCPTSIVPEQPVSPGTTLSPLAMASIPSGGVLDGSEGMQPGGGPMQEAPFLAGGTHYKSYCLMGSSCVVGF